MRNARIVVVALGGLLAVTGALAAVVLGEAPGAPVNELAVALVVGVYAAVAVVITVARPRHLVGRLMWCGAVAWGLGEGLLALAVHDQVDAGVPGAAWLGVLGSAGRGFGWLVLVLAVPLVFPDGRTPWPRRRTPAVVTGAAIGAFTLATLLSPTPLDSRLEAMDSPSGLPQRLGWASDLLAVSALGLSTVALALAVAGLVRRWRQGDELRRQQLLWFAAAFALPIAFLPFIATSVVEPWMFALVTVPVPAAVAVALLQRRLYDIQLAVSRSLTYVTLSALIAGLYAVTVGGVGALLQERGAAWLPWVAAGVVAVTFAPLRNALQQTANRLVYGQWSQPADVLAATGRRLSDATDVPGLLRTLTDELGTGLGLEYVEIADVRDRPLATYGMPTTSSEDTTLTAYGVRVGVLRRSRTRLRPADRRLLEDVARQLGAVVHAASLLDVIREAQERLVLAREEERRRIRRDLHDGLGPALAGLTLQVDTLRNQLGTASIDPDAELLRVRAGIQATVLDVRRIVEGLRPPALDELGLEGAVGQLADRLTRGTDLVVDVDVPALPPIPAAVEVATYRVAQEALTNVVRHAGATRADVRVTLRPDGLVLTVTDNGSGPGTGPTTPRPGGVGLGSMRGRAEEIGGTLHIDSAPAQGTRVVLWLPCAVTPATDRETEVSAS
ncbi:MAG TPA: sensor histidine kinase [Marmoricola sp.]|nr:sensor histidine kinase [Marmoricola sp.]